MLPRPSLVRNDRASIAMMTSETISEKGRDEHTVGGIRSGKHQRNHLHMRLRHITSDLFEP